MPFDIEQARKSGYSDDEIADYLGQSRSFNVEGARKAGYKTNEILAHLSDAWAKQTLPEDVKPSKAGAGRGAVNPPMAEPDAPEPVEVIEPVVKGRPQPEARSNVGNFRKPASLAAEPPAPVAVPAPTKTLAAPPMAAPRNRTEVLDDIVNEMEAGGDIDAARAAVERAGGSWAEVVAHATKRGSALVGTDRAPGQQGVTGPAQPGTMTGNEPGIVEAGVNTLKRAKETVGRNTDTLATEAGIMPPDVYAGRFAQRSRAIDAARPSADTVAQQQAISKAGEVGLGATLKALAENPMGTITSLADAMLQSLPSSVAGGAIGSLGGPGGAMIGAGAASASQEYAGAIVEAIEQAGGNPNNAQDVLRAMNDPKIMGAAREKGVKRGLVVGAFDALTAGIAGKFLKPALDAVQAGSVTGRAAVGQVAGATAKEAGMQMGGGMAGEAAGQAAAGEKTNWSDIVMEGLAEVPGGAIEAAGNIRHANAGPQVSAVEARKAQDARFDELAAEHGISPAAAAKIKETAARVPREKLGEFYKRAAAGLSKRGLAGKPVDEAALGMLDVPPEAVAPEVPREAAPVDDGTGLSTPAPTPEAAAPAPQPAAEAGTAAAPVAAAPVEAQPTAPETPDFLKLDPRKFAQQDPDVEITDPPMQRGKPAGFDPSTAEDVPTTQAGPVAQGVAPETQAMPSAPTEAAASGGIAGFKTAKGSTYEMHEDGTTSRNKAARSDPGHEGDFGAKARTVRTVYFDGKNSMLSAAGIEGLGPRGARVAIKDGKAWLLTWNEKDGRWGAGPMSRAVPISTTPTLGSHPLELWSPKDDVPGGYEAYSNMHAGNEIVEITPAAKNPEVVKASPVDEHAHAAASSPTNDRPEPTEAQAQAGNYAKGHTRINGLDISIENPQGSVRRGTDASGKAWENTLQHHYGYVKGTLAGDGDHSDVFIKPGTPQDFNGQVFVIDQIDPKTGKFDEHKAIIGASTEEEARAIYASNYAADWKGLGAITPMPFEAYRSWVKDGVKKKPLGKINAPQPDVADAATVDSGPAAVPGDQPGGGRAAGYVPDVQRGVDNATPAPETRGAPDQPVPDAGQPNAALSNEASNEAPAAAPSEPTKAPEPPAARPAPVEAPRGKLVQTWNGRGGHGMLEHAARQQRVDLRKKFPDLTWEVVPAPEFGENLFKLEGREAPAPAAPESSAAPTEKGATDGQKQEAAQTAEVLKPGKPVKAPRAPKHPDKVRGSRALAEISQRLGGLSPDLLADLSQKVNQTRTNKLGKKIAYTHWDNPAIPGVGPLFRTGGTADLSEVARVLEEAGFITAGTVDADPIGAQQQAQDIIQAELQEGGSTLEVGSTDAIEAEMRRRAEASMDDGADPWEDAPFAPSDFEEAGIAAADHEMLAMTQKLVDEAEALGIDTETIREDIARALGDEAPENDYQTAVQQALREAVAAIGRDAGQGDAAAAGEGDQGRGLPAEPQSREGSDGADGPDGTVQAGPAEEGLTLSSQTPEDLTAKADAEAAATKAAAAKKAAEQDRLRKAAEDKDAKARANQTVDDFQLGQSADQQMSGISDLFAEPPAAPSKSKKGAGIRAEKGDSEAVRKTKADAMAALGDLASILSKNTRANITPEQEQALLPVLTRLMDAAFRLGYLKFKEAARFALDQIRAALGDEAADQISIDHLQGAYIGMAGKYRDQGAERAAAVASVDNLDQLAEDSPQENPDHVPGADPLLERDRSDAAPVAAVEGDLFVEGSDIGPGAIGVEAGSRRDGRPDDPGLPAGGPVAGGKPRGDAVGRADRAAGPAEFDAGAGERGRGDEPGFEGVQPDAVAGGPVAQAPASGNSEVDRRRAQRAADSIAFKAADAENIRQTLPYLLAGQQEDVLKAEQRFAKPDGYGILFTNGTGTGKTFTGLGIVKRFARQGRENVLILVPDKKIMSDWVDSGRALGLTITPLENTKDSGQGITVTTYDNAGDNDSLASRSWDLIVPDEAHMLMQSQDAKETLALKAVRAISLHPRGTYTRFEMLNRADLNRQEFLSQQIGGLDKQISNPDTMDDAVPALRIRKAELEAEHKALSERLSEARKAVQKDVESRQGADRPRLVGLSATPFAYMKNVDWAEGYLFDYSEGQSGQDLSSGSGAGHAYNSGDWREKFFVMHFGFRMRHNKLNEPDAKVDTGLMQRQFNSFLKKRGVLSARMLDVDADYDRRFHLVDSAVGNQIDAAIEWLHTKAKDAAEAAKGKKPDEVAPNGFAMLEAELGDALYGKMGHLTRRYLLEAIKAKEVVPLIKEHMAKGRKVVVFHDFKKGGSVNPFDFRDKAPSAPLGPNATLDDMQTQAKYAQARQAYNMAAALFRKEFPDLSGDRLLSGLISPITRFERELPGVLLINGDEKPKDLLARYKAFNDDTLGPQVALVQSAKNKGWSGHDTTGKHQRVLFNLGLPTQPTMSIQQEGRIYRTGQVSNAIMRYLNTGTNWERWAFAQTIASRASTAENLAMGEQARALRDAFISAFEESGNFPAGHEGEGTGGKARDRLANSALSEFDRAKTFYFGTQKKDARTKAQEGKDYFATPEPLGLKMVHWLDLRGGEAFLEPSGGHGAIARWAPDNVERTAVEQSAALSSRLALVFDGKIVRGNFEDLHIVNKFDGIAMNPPFGVGGKLAVEHLAKAAGHLPDGGRVVAIIPTGPAADKRFEAWMYGEEDRPIKPLGTVMLDGKETPIYRGDSITSAASWAPEGKVTGWRDGSPMVTAGGAFRGAGASMVSSQSIKSVQSTGPRTAKFRPSEGLHLVANITLPQVTFERAGTGVMTRLVVIDRLAAGQEAPMQVNRDLTTITDIGELFSRIEDMEVPKRTKPVQEEQASPKEERAAEREQRQAEKANKEGAKAEGAKSAAASGLEVVEHTTGKGKVIKGVIRKDLTQAQAKEIDAYTWKKDGGYFIRLEHMAVMMEKHPPAQGEKPVFSRQPDASIARSPVSRGVNMEDAKGVRAQVMEALPKAPPIYLHESVNRAPKALAQYIRDMGAETTVEAVYFEGEIHAFPRNVESVERLQFVIGRHEVRHHGLRSLLSADERRALFLDLYQANESLRKAADEKMADGLASSRVEAVEEALADLDAGAISSLSRWDRFVAAVRQAMRAVAARLRGAGMNGLAKALNPSTWSDRDIAAMVARAEDVSRTGRSHYRGAGVAFSRTPAQKQALEKAGIRQRRLGDSVRESFGKAMDMLRERSALWNSFRQGTLDQFHGIRMQPELGGLPVDQDPYITARLANGGTSSVMRALLMHGQATWAGNGQHLVKVPGTKGLLQILEPVKGDLDAWFGWMIGNRAARLMREGRENNFTAADIQELQDLGKGREAEFRAVAAEFAAFKRSVLDIAEHAGLLDPSARAVWDHADWIPFYRQMDEAGAMNATGKRGLAGQSSGVRQLKGGSAALNDPLENILTNFSRLVDASLKNNAIHKTVRTLINAGSPIVKRVSYEFKAEIIPLDQVKKILKDHGTPPDLIDLLPPDALRGMAKMWALKAPEGPDIVRVMEGGKPAFYQVSEPLLLRALTSFVPFDFPGLGVARAAKRVLTGAVTATPDFMIRNFIRDTAASFMIARDGLGVPGVKAIKGIAKSYTEKGGYEDMLFAGASFQSGNINAGDPEGTAVAMRRALRAKGMDASAIESFLGTITDSTARLWEHYRGASEAVENANREAVFEAAKGNGKSTTAAAYEAKDLMDFNLRGSWAGYQLLADVLPFFNARVQGLYRLGRVGGPGAVAKAGLGRLAAYGSIMAVASVMLAMHNADIPEYEELEDWDKDTYWHFFVDGKHFRLPKPFELGLIFATYPERIYRGAVGKDGAKKTGWRILKGVHDTLAFDPIPQLFRPLFDVATNKASFTGRDIETQGDETKSPSQRYNSRTSDTARVAVQAANVNVPLADRGAMDMLGMSPKRVEYLIGGYLGTMGIYALQASDALVRAIEGSKPPGPTPRPDDWPVVKSFYRVDPARSTVYTTELYELAREVDQLHRDISAKAKEGNPEEAQAMADKAGAKLAVRKMLDKGTKTLSGLNKQADAVRMDPAMTPDEKRAAMDEIQRARNALARDVMTSEGVAALR